MGNDEKEVSLIYRIRDEASKVAEKITGSIGGLGNKATEVAKIFASSVGLGFLTAGAGLAALTATIGTFIKAAIESAKVQYQTIAVLKSTGEAAGLTASDIRALASEINDATGISKRFIQAGENMLLTFTNVKGGVFKEATKQMVDMAAAMNGGEVNADTLRGTAIQLGKALQDPVEGAAALQRVGVRLSESQKELVKQFKDSGDIQSAQKIILAELNREFEGSAEAYDLATGGAGKLNTQIGTLKKTFGDLLLPAVKDSNTAMTEFVQGMNEGLKSNTANNFFAGISYWLEMAKIMIRAVFVELGILPSAIMIAADTATLYINTVIHNLKVKVLETLALIPGMNATMQEKLLQENARYALAQVGLEADKAKRLGEIDKKHRDEKEKNAAEIYEISQRYNKTPDKEDPNKKALAEKRAAADLAKINAENKARADKEAKEKADKEAERTAEKLKKEKDAAEKTLRMQQEYNDKGEEIIKDSKSRVADDDKQQSEDAIRNHQILLNSDLTLAGKFGIAKIELNDEYNKVELDSEEEKVLNEIALAEMAAAKKKEIKDKEEEDAKESYKRIKGEMVALAEEVINTELDNADRRKEVAEDYNKNLADIDKDYDRSKADLLKDFSRKQFKDNADKLKAQKELTNRLADLDLQKNRKIQDADEAKNEAMKKSESNFLKTSLEAIKAKIKATLIGNLAEALAQIAMSAAAAFIPSFGASVAVGAGQSAIAIGANAIGLAAVDAIKFADGGMVSPSSGGTTVVMGEAGETELGLPEHKVKAFLQAAGVDPDRDQPLEATIMIGEDALFKVITKATRKNARTKRYGG